MAEALKSSTINLVNLSAAEIGDQGAEAYPLRHAASLRRDFCSIFLPVLEPLD